MESLPRDINTLWEHGLQSQPSKMSKLINHVKEIGQFLELSDIEDLLLSGIWKYRNLKTVTSWRQCTMSLYNVLSGLYREDMGTLKMFARKHDVERPLFGHWCKHEQIVPEVHGAYRHKALQGAQPNNVT
ncbi:MAG: hypothetical protein JKY34_00310 [Kordiimonadaceae bacterium]|nr:hypothetical protein [Kordiimonadaceae bacterium]